MEYPLEEEYFLDRMIGSGGFGTVYEGHDITNTDHKVAVKVELLKDDDDEDLYKDVYLEKEDYIYQKLIGKDSVGIANIRLFGFDEGCDGPRSYLVMDLLGPDLEELLHQCSGKFSLKTALLLADQMIRILQYVHSRGYIHGDIKPGNFLFGRKKKHKTLHLIDFGLAKEYRDPLTKEHIPYSNTAHYQGTTRFSSLNCHQGIEQSRRDDLESLGYVLLYLLRGNLPWQHFIISESSDKKKKRRLVGEKKLSTSIEKLCRGQPSEFETYMKYCRSLQFNEEPDYTYLQTLFKDLFKRSPFTDNSEFDWGDRKFKSEKFVVDESIDACDVLPWEMKYFMKVEFDHVTSHINMEEATVEDIVEESFRFVFPNEVPKYCKYNDVSKKLTWKEIAPKMYTDFLADEYIYMNWFKEQFNVDYTNAQVFLSAEVDEQRKKLREAIPPSNSCKVRQLAQCAISLHRMFWGLYRYKEIADTSSERDNLIKSAIYNMFTCVNVGGNDPGKFGMIMAHLKEIGNRDREKVVITSKPDCVLLIDCESGQFPYGAVQVLAKVKSAKENSTSVMSSVHSSTSENREADGVKSLSNSTKSLPEEHTTSGIKRKTTECRNSKTTSDSDEFKQPVTKKINKMTTNKGNTTTESTVKKSKEWTEYLSESFCKQLTEDIKQHLPVECQQDLDFHKSAGQLVMDLFALSVKKEGVKLKLYNAPRCPRSTSIGFFVSNEYVHLVKFEYNCQTFRQIFERDIFNYWQEIDERPKVSFNNWCFNLKKTYDRLALMCFIYHYHHSFMSGYVEYHLKKNVLVQDLL